MRLPFQHSDFNLDVSGIIGFFGGEGTISAMATVHMYGGRRWLGWYNAPGSYTIAQKYGQLPKSRFWDGLFPGVNVTPTLMFEFDGPSGPKFAGVASGSVLEQTGYPAFLFAKYCREKRPTASIYGRPTTPIGVTIVRLTDPPACQLQPVFKSWLIPTLASVAIGVNIATCVLTAIYGEWFSFSLILYGMLCNGFSSFIIGSGMLIFKHPKPSLGSPPGDGFLLDHDQVILLKGPEGAINSITRGKFFLWYPRGWKHNDIGLCAFALTVQFLLQLFLIPLSRLFGQILFLASLFVSYLYNLCLCSIDKEELRQNMFLRILDSRGALIMKKYCLPSHSSMAVFATLEMLTNSDASRARNILDSFIPNSTPVWDLWKIIVEREVQRVLSDPTVRPQFSSTAKDVARMSAEEITLLLNLLADAQAGFNGFTLARDGGDEHPPITGPEIKIEEVPGNLEEDVMQAPVLILEENGIELGLWRR